MPFVTVPPVPEKVLARCDRCGAEGRGLAAGQAGRLGFFLANGWSAVQLSGDHPLDDPDVLIYCVDCTSKFGFTS